LEWWIKEAMGGGWKRQSEVDDRRWRWGMDDGRWKVERRTGEKAQMGILRCNE
jgi:hypothetical protein